MGQRISASISLMNVSSAIVLAAAGITLSRVLIAPRFGLTLLVFALLLTVPVAMVLIAKPRFGVFVLFAASMLIIEVKRLSWELEVGLVIEFLEGLLALGLVSSMVARRDVYRLSSPLTLPVTVYVLYQVMQAAHPALPTIYNILYALRDPINFSVPFFAALYLVRDRAHLRLFLSMWLGMAVAIALYGLWQYYVGLNNWEIAWLSISRTHLIYDRLRIFSTLGSADALGMHMAVSIVLALALAWCSSRKLTRAAVLAMVPLFVLTDLQTLTRGAYMAAVVGVFTLAIVTRSRALLIGLLVAGMIAVGWYQLNQSSLLASRVMTMFLPEQDESFAIRQSYLEDYLPVIIENPFGLGPATSGRQGWVLLEWGGVDPRLVEGLAGVPTDNYYFRVALETGWVGLLLFLGLLATILVVGLRTYSATRDPLAKWTAAAFLAAYVAMAVASISNNYFSHVQLKLFFWFSLGILACLRRIASGLEPEKAEPLVTRVTWLQGVRCS